MNRQQAIDILASQTAELRQRFGVTRLALFGSVARDESTSTSDLDLLVEFDRPITLFDLVAVQQRLEQLLGVPKVDLVLRDCIYPELKASILAEAIDVV